MLLAKPDSTQAKVESVCCLNFCYLEANAFSSNREMQYKNYFSRITGLESMQRMNRFLPTYGKASVHLLLVFDHKKSESHIFVNIRKCYGDFPEKRKNP